MFKTLITLTSVTLLSLSVFAQQRHRINVVGELVVLNILYNGNAVDVKKLVAVTTVPGTNSIRIERAIQPGSVKDSIRLIVPTTACEKLPAYVLFRNGQLYFFLDISKSSGAFKNTVCDKYEISYPLNYFNLEAAEDRTYSTGLLIPRVTLSRPFEFLESNNVADVDIPTDLNGSYVLYVKTNGSKILGAMLSVKKILGQDEYVIQTLP